MEMGYQYALADVRERLGQAADQACAAQDIIALLADLEAASRSRVEHAKKRGQAQRSAEEYLRAAIERHRMDVWGSGPVKHDCDTELYGALERIAQHKMNGEV